MEFDVVTDVKGKILENEATNKKVDNTNEDEGAENVGEKAVHVANRVATQEMEGIECPFEGVYAVDDEVEEKAPGNTPMQQRGEFTVANNAPLGKKGDSASDEAAWKIFQVKFALAMVNDLSHLPEAVVSGR
jgi:hypothetical protein